MESNGGGRPTQEEAGSQQLDSLALTLTVPGEYLLTVALYRQPNRRHWRWGKWKGRQPGRWCQSSWLGPHRVSAWFLFPSEEGLEVGGYKCQNLPLDLHPLPVSSGPGHSHGNRSDFLGWYLPPEISWKKRQNVRLQLYLRIETRPHTWWCYADRWLGTQAHCMLFYGHKTSCNRCMLSSYTWYTWYILWFHLQISSELPF